jgi:type VI protein secretion system component VasF
VNDDRLHDAFTELRRHESARAPRFERLWRERPPQRRRLPIASLAFVVLVLIAGAFVTFRHQPQRPTIAEWHAPTDFLLNTPGHELIHSVPDLKGTIR